MENSALNKAHLQHRRAEYHMRCRRFNEAIECHKNAAEFLNEALNCTQNPRSIESIKLQREFHLRQNNIILAKREQFEKYRLAMENQGNKMYYNVTSDEENGSLQVLIYRTMEEADSLLGMLIKKGSSGNSDSESLKSFSTTDTDEKDGSSSGNCVIGSKHPKDETVVIEELRTLNEQLHGLVQQLVTQLESSNREVDTLKEKIKQLESDKSKGGGNNKLKVITDSSGGTSPYVFSPCSEFSPEVQEHRTLPLLAPLEMPSFDFGVKNGTGD